MESLPRTWTTIDSFTGEFSFLSNFYPAETRYEGRIWPTAEHAFQAAKTIHHAERVEIARLATPGQAKRAGRKVTLRPNWDTARVGIMNQIVYEKFFSNPELASKLIDTQGTPLIEGNAWNDRFWGVCRGEGLNHLGVILMSVRDQLAQDATERYLAHLWADEPSDDPVLDEIMRQKGYDL